MIAPGPVSASDGPDVFFALADPTRRWMIRQLASGAIATPTALARDLPITRQAVSRHLRVLQESKLVTVESTGRESHYRLAPEPLEAAVEWIATIENQWKQRLAALGQYLASQSG